MNNLDNNMICDINEGITLSDLQNKYNLSTEDLYKKINELKSYGFNIVTKLYQDGNIYISTIRNYDDYNLNNLKSDSTIITYKNTKNIRFIVISDIHAGSSKYSQEALDKVFNFAKKNNINIILNCGDFVDGTFGWDNKRYKYDVYDQIEKIIKDYPSDPTIYTIGVAGDHDFDAYMKSGIDIRRSVSNQRPDIIIPSYGKLNINIKNDNIALYHKIDSINTKEPRNCSLLLKGHTHSSNIYDTDRIVIDVPSLSKISESGIPYMLSVELIFDKSGYIQYVDTTIYDILNEIKLTTINSKVHLDHDVKTSIPNEEEKVTKVISSMKSKIDDSKDKIIVKKKHKRKNELSRQEIDDAIEEMELIESDSNSDEVKDDAKKVAVQEVIQEEPKKETISIKTDMKDQMIQMYKNKTSRPKKVIVSRSKFIPMRAKQNIRKNN